MTNYGHNQKQAEALDYIKWYIRTHGYPPSRREIAERFNMRSASTAQKLLERMVEEGLIEVTPGVSRGVMITGSNMKHGEVTL